MEEERAGCFALLSFGCLVTVNVLSLFLTVPWIGLCVIVVFPDIDWLQLYHILVAGLTLMALYNRAI